LLTSSSRTNGKEVQAHYLLIVGRFALFVYRIEQYTDIQRGQIFRPLTNNELEPLFHWFLRRKLARGVENRPKGENNKED